MDSDDESDHGYDAPGFSSGKYHAETVALRDLVKLGEPTPMQVKALINAKANPCWPGRRFDEGSAVQHAVSEEMVDLLRVMHANWPDIDPPWPEDDDSCYPLLDWALEEERPKSAKCLMELGFSYKRFEARFQELALSTVLPARPDPRYHAWDREEGSLWEQLYANFFERENACRRAAITLMSKAFRSRGLLRDVACIVARNIWQTRRAQEWESRDTADRWQMQRKRRREAARIAEDESCATSADW